QALVLVGVSVQLSGFATSIYLHRCLAHRAVWLHPLPAFFMRLQLWLATGIVPREWVAVHRKHHHFPDTEGDPHSPLLLGLSKVLFGNAYYYAREAAKPETLDRYASDICQDWLDRHLFHYGGLGIGVGLVICVALLGPWWGIPAYLALGATYIFLNAVINGVCHVVGYKNFSNTATNLRSVAWLTGGEGLHNNHHAFPSSPKFSVRASEFDPAWPVLRLLAQFRLAKLRPVPAQVNS
ncbi:MAG: acyl-CoA desaturase, partial [Terriglobia bacterium]